MPTSIPINLPAVLVSAVAAMVLGFLWYGPLFGKTWMQLMGLTPAKIAEAKNKGGMGKNYAITFVGVLVMAFVLQHSLIFASAYLQVYGLSAGLQGAFWNWLGFIVPVTIGSVLWEGKSWKLWMLNAGHYLTMLLLMGVIQALWA